MNIAIIVCTNGLGHVSRQTVLAEYLLEKNYKVEIFAPKIYVKKVAPHLLEHCNNFDTNTTINDWMQNKATKWVSKISSLDRFDKIISDNLIDILRIRPDSYLSASFFWHKVLKISDEIYMKQQSLLDLYKPKIIANKYFAQPYLSQFSNLHKIGFIVKDIYNPIDSKITHVDNRILMQSGSGESYTKEKLKQHVQSVINSKSSMNLFSKIYIEKDCYDKRLPNNYKIANFDKEMFENIDIIIGRAGLGIITKALSKNISFISVDEKNNSEMTHNTEVLNKFFGCARANSFCDALSISKNYKNDFTKVDIDGGNQFLNLLEIKNM